MRPDRLIALTLLVLAAGAPRFSLAQSSPTQSSPTKSSPGPEIGQLLRHVNMQRALNGAGPLALDERLSAAARKHAEDMLRRDYFDHRSPDGRGFQDRVASEGYPWRAIAENLGAGLSSARSTVEGWMTSPGHRDNMLDPQFADAGIGYAAAPPEGKRPRYAHYWVILFGARSR